MYYEKMDDYDNDKYPICNYVHVILSSQENSIDVSDYRYEVAHEFTGKEMLEVAEWAEQICTDIWLIGCSSSGFNNKEDAAMFKLTWC
jgi:hypothetical protein